MAVVLSKGSRGELVKRLQAALNLVQDGIFGAVTEEAVKAFQKAHGLVPDGVVGEKTWTIIVPNESSLHVSRRTINRIIVHCTATPEGRVESYHYLIGLNGERWNGRNVNLVGAHCEGYNANSIGVCYVGGCDKNMKAKDTRTDKQKAALIALLKDLRKLYPKAKIVSHRDLDRKGKACPSFDATNEYKNI